MAFKWRRSSLVGKWGSSAASTDGAEANARASNPAKKRNRAKRMGSEYTGESEPHLRPGHGFEFAPALSLPHPNPIHIHRHGVCLEPAAISFLPVSPFLHPQHKEVILLVEDLICLFRVQRAVVEVPCDPAQFPKHAIGVIRGKIHSGRQLE